MRTTIRLRDELLQRAKDKAAREGRTLPSVIEEGLFLALAERPRVEPGPVRVPTSRAKGGVLPGIDLNDSRALEERMSQP